MLASGSKNGAVRFSWWEDIANFLVNIIGNGVETFLDVSVSWHGRRG